MTDDRDAAWEAVHDATPGAGSSGYHAAVRRRTWRWMLAPLVIVVAGCLTQPTLPPESFLQRVRSTGSSFVVMDPPPGASSHLRQPGMQMDEVINTAMHAMEENDTPVQAIYGMVTCPDAATCSQAFDTNPNPRIDRSNVSAFPVWVVWSLATEGPDVGVWFAINADTNKGFGGRCPGC